MNCRLIAFTLCLGFCSMPFSFGADVTPEDRPTEVISLAPDIQQEIARAVALISSGNMSEDNVEKSVREFIGLEKIAPGELLLQVLAVYGGKDEYRKDPGSEMAKRLLLSTLLQDMAPADIVATVAPKYEQAIDLKLQQSLRHALDMASFKNGRVDPDFDGFSSYVERNKEQPPRKLVRYMYGLNPQVAGLTMARIYGGETTERQLAEQLKGDPSTAIQYLVDRREWWAHLYVATMVEKDPDLQTPDIMKRLQDEKDPLVREILARLPVPVETSSTNEIPVASVETITTVELQIPFESDKADIGVETHSQLDEIVEILKADPQLTARIEGHTDKTRRSAESYSKQLTARRAQAVLDYLVNSGGIEAN
ncbi:MAG: OmpA family protein, partial [Kiritimatiellia bacterium]